MPLDLLVPGLLPPASELRLPHLERWLARADVAHDAAATAEAWLSKRFGLHGVPVAPVTLAVDEAPQPGQWLRADPVYARVERDSLVLHHAAVLAIEPEEARALVESLRELFEPDGIEFRVPRPNRWYARVPAGELPETTPLAEAIGRDVFRRLPRGEGRINWPSAVTEIQMLFATHPVNLAREAVRKPPINAVWFWGGGVLPRDLTSPFQRVYAEEPFASGLAHLAAAEWADPPQRVQSVEGAGDMLVVLDEAARCLDEGNLPGWESSARRLDNEWFAGLGTAIGRFGQVRIVLPAGGRVLVATLTASSRWRLFRARRPLGAHGR